MHNDYHRVQGACKLKTDTTNTTHVIVNNGTKDIKITKRFEEIGTRKIYRRIAKKMMKLQGKTRVCSDPPKSKGKAGSYFATKWKEVVNYG